MTSNNADYITTVSEHDFGLFFYKDNFLKTQGSYLAK